MNGKSSGRSRLNQSDQAIHHDLLAMKRTPHQVNPPASPLLRNLALLVIILSAFVVNGCSTIPPRLYTTNDPATRSAEDPNPCDTFTYGEHPIVVIEGFKDVPEATLEILANGQVIGRRTISMSTGQIEGSGVSSSSTYSSLAGGYVQQDRLDVVVNAGAKVDLGAIAPGTYVLNLKTNDIVAAVASFKVNLPADLETGRQKIESERLKLQQVADHLKQLNAEINRDRATQDQSNPAMVAAFNARVADYNQLVQQAKASQAQFNIMVQNFNNCLESLRLPQSSGHEPYYLRQLF